MVRAPTGSSSTQSEETSRRALRVIVSTQDLTVRLQGLAPSETVTDDTKRHCHPSS